MLLELCFCNWFSKFVRRCLVTISDMVCLYMLCQAVNEQWLTLDFVRIFVMMFQVGSVNCELCACLCVYV